MGTVNFPMFKLVLEKAEEPEIKLPISAESWKKQECSRKTSISTYAKAFDCVDHKKLWKILKEMDMPEATYPGMRVGLRKHHYKQS